ncbi:C-type lectin domain family 10 member A isoform X3 [Silurus meridionalis]|uniref:C-type lectin domain family 10 member A isoform X3 n=1 Tax=Silurus meridionalis TaxID=175797 RepID=UPI001EE9EA85|nr:C-type lectin domain family 10 member A isoform X3 [Silurus meridionalis]
MRDTSETHDDEHDNFDTRDDTAFWRKEGSFSVIPSFNGSFSFTGCSRWCVCMFTVLAIFLLAIIISISLNSADAVRSVNGLRLSLNSLQTQAQDFLTEVNNIKESVTQLKCHFDTLQNNTQQQCCPMDWQLFSSHCYYFSTYGKSWNEARDTCVNMKAELLILKNKEEKGFVIKNTKPLFYWLGLSDERTGEWEWLDGTLYQMDKRDWMPGQPDNWHLHGLGGGEDCAHFHSDGRYNDDHCSRNYRFICKSLAYRV